MYAFYVKQSSFLTVFLPKQWKSTLLKQGKSGVFYIVSVII